MWTKIIVKTNFLSIPIKDVRKNSASLKDEIREILSIPQVLLRSERLKTLERQRRDQWYTYAEVNEIAKHAFAEGLRLYV